LQIADFRKGSRLKLQRSKIDNPQSEIRNPKSAIETIRNPQLREVRMRAARDLAQAQIESPHLTAELLLGHVLDWDRVRVLTGFDAVLDKESKERFFEAVRRRIQGEPLQHIIGRQEFYGRIFHVSPAVMIPRPETEILVDGVLSLAKDRNKALRFADVGTGSGCIAVSVAAEMPGWSGWAVDLSLHALAIARQNAIQHRVCSRLQFVCTNLLEAFPPQPAFDFILSNPPYVARRDAASLPDEVRDHEPHLALFGGELGLEVYFRLVPQAAARLLPGGHLILEVGIGQSQEVARLIESEGLTVMKVLDDLRAIPRCILASKNR
jgi:release factor glutamine methyltransferase